MSAPIAQNVPNVPIDPMFEVKDNQVILTSVGKDFFESFIKFFFTNFSNEGLVAPTQTATNLTTIQNNQNSQSQYTCQYGTILYDSTDNSIRISINNGSGAPIFKTVTLT